MGNLLEIKNLRVSAHDSRKPDINILNGINLKLDKGQALALVGESGSGKTTTAMAVMGLLDASKGIKVKGTIAFEEKNIMDLRSKEFNRIRGNEISMVFQEPMTALHPYMPVGRQIEEILEIHGCPDKAGYRNRVIEAMHEVGLPEPEKLYGFYPSQLSGGLKQRVVIAMSIITRPKLLIADEPTTALDVTTQAQILSLLLDLKRKLGLSMILITHDLGVVAEMADQVAVMYYGRVLEYGPVAKILTKPCHPYTLGLIKCIPYLDNKKDELYSIPGLVPRPSREKPQGCAFYQRCLMRRSECMCGELCLMPLEEDHLSECLFWKEIINEPAFA